MWDRRLQLPGPASDASEMFAKEAFGLKRNPYVIADRSQQTESDSLYTQAPLGRLVLHGLITVLLLAAAVGMGW